ncbi:MAG: hypothetical protein QNL33_15015 [Akkermansiaceae bacterium]|jgi:hypothetical protein
MMKFSSLLGFCALFPMIAFGDGSVDLVDLGQVFQTNPLLAKSLNASLTLEPVGDATRLGPQVGDLGGARIGPYEFEATLRDQVVQSASVLVTLHTDVKFLDAGGRVLLFDDIKPETVGLKISETLLRYEVAAAPLVAPVTAPQPAADGLVWSEFQLPFDEGESGTCRRGTLDGSLKELEINYDEDEISGWTFSIGFDEKGLPERVIASSSTFRQVAPGKTEDQIKTRILEYQGGKLVKVSSSEVTDAQGLPTNFEDLMVTSVSSNRVYRTAAQMQVAEKEQLVDLVQDAVDAQNRLTEPLVRADDSRWKPIAILAQPMLVDASYTTTAAALFYLRNLRLLAAADSAEQPAHLWTDLLSLKDGVTSVLVTASGYQDDEIECERFLVQVTQLEGGWQLASVSKQVKKWRGEDWE